MLSNEMVLSEYNIIYKNKFKSMYHLNKKVSIEDLVKCINNLKFDEIDMTIEEIYTSSAIENNTLTKWEMAKVIRGGIEEDKLEDSFEVRNLIQAKNLYNNYPITEDIIKSTHMLICLNTHSGKELLDYREENVYIEGSSFVPPNYTLVKTMMTELTKREINDIVDIFKYKLKFVSIHPFIDGNGRTSRLIMNSMLEHNGFGRLHIRPNEKELYCEFLENAQVDGKLDEYLRFMLNYYIFEYYDLGTFKSSIR